MVGGGRWRVEQDIAHAPLHVALRQSRTVIMKPTGEGGEGGEDGENDEVVNVAAILGGSSERSPPAVWSRGRA